MIDRTYRTSNGLRATRRRAPHGRRRSCRGSDDKLPRGYGLLYAAGDSIAHNSLAGWARDAAQAQEVFTREHAAVWCWARLA